MPLGCSSGEKCRLNCCNRRNRKGTTDKWDQVTSTIHQVRRNYTTSNKVVSGSTSMALSGMNGASCIRNHTFSAPGQSKHHQRSILPRSRPAGTITKPKQASKARPTAKNCNGVAPFGTVSLPFDEQSDAADCGLVTIPRWHSLLQLQTQGSRAATSRPTGCRVWWRSSESGDGSIIGGHKALPLIGLRAMTRLDPSARLSVRFDPVLMYVYCTLKPVPSQL